MPARQDDATAALQAGVVLDKLLRLAREIRTPCAYVGYAAFVILALRYGVRPFMWEGDTRVDIVNTYAPWQEERCNVLCAVDGVCCCLGPAVAGAATLFPVSKEHPLNECQHFLAAARIEAGVAGEGLDIVPFYTRLGVAVLGTVMDGDCGVDAMCGMLQRPQAHGARVNIRENCTVTL